MLQGFANDHHHQVMRRGPWVRQHPRPANHHQL